MVEFASQVCFVMFIYWSCSKIKQPGSIGILELEVRTQG